MGNRQQIELRPSFGGACGCVVMTPWWRGVKAVLPLNASNLSILTAPLAHKASKILTWSGLDTRLSAPIGFPTSHALLLYARATCKQPPSPRMPPTPGLPLGSSKHHPSPGLVRGSLEHRSHVRPQKLPGHVDKGGTSEVTFSPLYLQMLLSISKFTWKKNPAF